nr:exosortase A [Rhodovibrio sodomensis]
MIGCLVAVGGLFHEALAGLVGIWLSSATYSYGFLIPPVALYLAYRRRHRLTGMTLDPSLLGAAGILAAGSVWFMGELGDIDLLRHLGAVVGIQATVVAVVGLRIARVLALPLAYLLLAVPLADGLVEPLQWLTADYTVELLRLTGVPVYLDGWFLTIPGGTFHVAEACAGVRYLVACLAFGVVAADSFFTRTWKRWAFVVISLIVPIGANVVRAYGIVMLAHLSDFEIAVGVDHLIYGGIFLSFVTVVLILVAAAMRDPAAVPAQAVAPVQAIAPAQPDVASASTPKTRSRWRAARAAGVIVIALFGLAGLRGYAAAVAPASAPVGPVEIEPPQVAGWADPRPARSTWQPSFPSADATAVWRYTKAQSTVELFVARYTPLRPGAELVAMQNDLAGGERNTVMARGVTSVDGGGAWPPPAYLRLATRDGERLVWYWYVVGGEATTTGWRAKARRLALQLLGPVDGAAVAVATQAGPEAQSRLRSFMADADLRGTLGARNGSRQGD